MGGEKMIHEEIQRQISAREYLILSYKDKINRIQNKIDALGEEIIKLKIRKVNEEANR